MAQDTALVLSADHYSIPDASGVVQHLHQVWYINEYRENSPTERGSKPIKMLVAPEVFAELVKHDLPALFDLDLRSRPGKGNAAALTVVGFKHVGTPSIFPVATAKKAA
jgi:hypothetical protein